MSGDRGAGDEYDKLVRDDIPAIVEADGDTPVTRRVDGAEYEDYLAAKLIEEVEEYAESRQPGELADVFEVVAAICEATDVSLEAIEARRAEKRARRGGFEEGIVLERVERGGRDGESAD
jgi:predicted house-cleaning noncanonical NTP pyrophosphatase (MazG superfamily)